VGSYIDHVDIRVSDMDASRAFYEAVLEPLGIGVTQTRPDPNGGAEIGFGAADGTEFAIHEPTGRPGQDTVTTGAHIAFSAKDRAAVKAFHRAALDHGGRDIGAPGPRPVYSQGYYGAFVLDPDGNNVEAICHVPAGR
jgi:catechol 2,3-dioxygenase-like lactoylglutathione lyase family enzyme